MAGPTNLSEFLSPLGSIRAIGPTNQILLVAYYLRLTGHTQFNITTLRETFLNGTLPPPDALDVRVRQLTQGKRARLMRMGHQFSLSIHGQKEVEDFISDKRGSTNASRILEDLISRTNEESQKKFIAEAIVCLKGGAKRATVTMTWLLTVDHLFEYVLRHHLASFNTALGTMFQKKPPQISKKDDFGDLKEVKFIEALRAAQLISNDVRKILDEKLGIRNTCAHPSVVEVHESKVLNFIEDLVDNVILKYPL